MNEQNAVIEKPVSATNESNDDNNIAINKYNGIDRYINTDNNADDDIDTSLKVQKRDGRIVDFDNDNIISAIMRAFKDINHEATAEDVNEIENIANRIEGKIKENYSDRPVEINEIQNLVEHSLLDAHMYDVANAYKDYRWKKDVQRAKQTDANEAVKKFLRKDKTIMNENANKDSDVYATQRDLLAGAISKASFYQVAPKDVVNAHMKGDIHFHDADYSLSKMTNCSLPNFRDMLNHGFRLGNADMGSAKSIGVASTQITQIIQAVASSQYGGQTVNRMDEVLAPFAMKDYRKNYEQAKLVLNDDMDIEQAQSIVDSMKSAENKNLHIEGRPVIKDVPFEDETTEIGKLRSLYAKILTRKNIYDAMQTLEYQTNTTYSSSTGQTPFITVGFGLGTGWAEREITRCLLYVRIGGLGERHLTAIFPKLTYTIKHGVNSEPSDPNYDLKQLALECTSKRMYPDILFYENIVNITGSFKAPMGAVSGQEVITWNDGHNTYTESFAHMWSRLAARYDVKHQGTDGDDWYIDLPENITIKDSHTGEAKFVRVKRIINNQPREWRRIVFENGRVIKCTDDHPFEVHGKGRVLTDNLEIGDVIDKSIENNNDGIKSYNDNTAWLLGFIICDGCLNESSEILVSYNGKSEQEIADRIANMFDSESLRFKHQERGEKGIYDEISIKDKWLRTQCVSEFGGIQKLERCVPSSIMNATRNEKVAFMAGMIDADGYVNDSQFIQIGSTNKTLAISQMLLAESLGLTARIYVNHYNASMPQYVRYSVSFPATDEIINALACNKKKAHYISTPEVKNEAVAVKSIEVLNSDERSYDVTTETDYFDVSGLVSHNCRSFLQGWINPETGKDEEEGRMNLGVVTVNLPRIAIEAKGNTKRFWRIFNSRMEVAHHALQYRIQRTRTASPVNAPVLWEYGAFGRLKSNDSINELMKNSRATVSLGYIGLYETTAAFFGADWVNNYGWDEDARQFALSILKKMTALCEQWENEEGYHYSVYGTPAESLTDRFNKLDSEKFGRIPAITDKDFYTNSFHRPVWLSGCPDGEPSESIKEVMKRPSFHVANNGGAASKLDFESVFLPYTAGGHIVYVEYPSMRQNLKGLEAMWDYAHEIGIDYLGSNTPIDHCDKCGYYGDCDPTETGYECPVCHNTDRDTLAITKRLCGYLGEPSRRGIIHGRYEEMRSRAKEMQGETGRINSTNAQVFYKDLSKDPHKNN